MYSNNPNGSNPAASYLHQEITTEDPLARIARIYDMAGLEIARARAAIAATDMVAKARSVHQASRCISVLHSSLDLDRGGEVAMNLDRLYTYLLRRLAESHAANDDAGFAEIAAHLSELGQAWREASSRKATAPMAAATQINSGVEAMVAR